MNVEELRAELDEFSSECPVVARFAHGEQFDLEHVRLGLVGASAVAVLRLSAGPDVPAKLDAAADVLDDTGREHPASALRGIARLLRSILGETGYCPPDVRAAVARALAGGA